MMRNTPRKLISNFGFGHANLFTAFGNKVQIKNAAPLKDAGVVKTTLPNGATVVTHDLEGPTAHVAFYVDAGAKYDAVFGLNHVMRMSMLQGNMAVSHFQNDRQMRSRGAAFGNAEVGKRYIGWTTDVARDYFGNSVEVIGTALAVPRFAEYDVERYRDTMDAQLEEMRWQNPREYAVNRLEEVGFAKEPLGNPRMTQVLWNDKCNGDQLLTKYCQQVVPANITLVGVNVDHQELVAKYNALDYSHSATAPHHQRAAKMTLSHTEEAKQFSAGAQFLEQENRPKVMMTKPDYEQETIAAIGWNAGQGADGTVAARAAVLVAGAMMNVSAHSGINYTRIETHFGMRAFARLYSSTALLGFTVRSAPENIAAELKAAQATLPTDYAGQLAAAKARATMEFYNGSAEKQQDYAALLATSQHSLAEVLGGIDAVQVADVAAVFESMKAQNPVLFATGDVSATPSLRGLGYKF
jgi:processing peptidase subunit alpha